MVYTSRPGLSNSKLSWAADCSSTQEQASGSRLDAGTPGTWYGLGWMAVLCCRQRQHRGASCMVPVVHQQARLVQTWSSGGVQTAGWSWHHCLCRCQQIRQVQHAASSAGSNSDWNPGLKQPGTTAKVEVWYASAEALPSSMMLSRCSMVLSRHP